METKIQQKRKELEEINKVYENLLAPVSEPEPCGIRILRCSNCHRIGHRAEGNSGRKSCPNEKCTNYFKCGQERFHNDFRQEKRQVEENLKSLKREIKDLEAEKAMVESYQQSGNSFSSVMRERLRKSNPSKYIKSSALLKDIIILKKYYKNEIPPQSTNDAEEFRSIIEKSYNKEKEWKNDTFEYERFSEYPDFPDAQPKKMKTSIPYQQQFFPFPYPSLPSTFYPYSYPYPCPISAPVQVPSLPMQLPTPVQQSPYPPRSISSAYSQRTIASTISSKEDDCNPFENKLDLLASAASAHTFSKDMGQSDRAEVMLNLQTDEETAKEQEELANTENVEESPEKYM